MSGLTRNKSSGGLAKVWMVGLNDMENGLMAGTPAGNSLDLGGSKREHFGTSKTDSEGLIPLNHALHAVDRKVT